MILAFVQASRQLAACGVARELGLLWTESILGEYDRNLQERYSLFGFYGSPEEISGKIGFYARDALRGRQFLKYQGNKCDLYDYRLSGLPAAKKQILTAGRFAAAGKLAGIKKEIQKSEAFGGTVRNRKITGDLPSSGFRGSFSVRRLSERLSDGIKLSDMLKEGSDRYFEDVYMKTFFKETDDPHGLGKTCFQNEIEYIICGKYSDEENLKQIRKKVVALRFILNMAYLVHDPERSGEMQALAELLTPGPAAAVTQKAMETAWALAESNNDWELLMNGKKVPWLKTHDSWAVRLESVFTGKMEETEDPYFHNKVRYIDPGSKKGAVYSDYLSRKSYW